MSNYSIQELARECTQRAAEKMELPRPQVPSIEMTEWRDFAIAHMKQRQRMTSEIKKYLFLSATSGLYNARAQTAYIFTDKIHDDKDLERVVQHECVHHVQHCTYPAISLAREALTHLKNKEDAACRLQRLIEGDAVWVSESLLGKRELDPQLRANRRFVTLVSRDARKARENYREGFEMINEWHERGKRRYINDAYHRVLASIINTRRNYHVLQGACPNAMSISKPMWRTCIGASHAP